MRIVGGSLRGRKLAVPKTQNIRPTTDRVRESLFNILEHGYSEVFDETSVLDIFAGTGALGIEALSRGALEVTFMETGTEALGLLQRNVETLGLAAQTSVLRRDATKAGRFAGKHPVDLILADPPYGKGLGEKALLALSASNWLADNALAVLEENKAGLPHTIDGFDMLERRNFGETAIGLFRHNPNRKTMTKK